ncbi:MAG: hypothetical protein JWO46_1203 [Nocardioidaceae bacterium]|nr:hypothetical protein [Nocardioidaceae bacterium]
MDTPIPAGSTAAPYVVVGVNGSSSDPSAVRYAVAEARADGAERLASAAAAHRSDAATSTVVLAHAQCPVAVVR